MTKCTLCDTLVNDEGNADECVVCGAVYDMGRRVGTHTFIPPTPAPAPAKPEAPGGLTVKSRGVKTRHINGFRR